jgi:hypothetical protein
MKIIFHNSSQNKIAEVISDRVIINNLEDALDLIANIYHQESEKIIINEKNISPDFFSLSTGLAGEILGKCANYKIKLAVVGDYSKYKSKSLSAFIIECNRGNQFFFVNDIEKAKEKLMQ